MLVARQLRGPLGELAPTEAWAEINGVEYAAGRRRALPKVGGQVVGKNYPLYATDKQQRPPTDEEWTQITSCANGAWKLVGPYGEQNQLTYGSSCARSNFAVGDDNWRNFYRDQYVEKLYDPDTGAVAVVVNKPSQLQSAINWALENCKLWTIGAAIGSGGTAAAGTAAMCQALKASGAYTGGPAPSDEWRPITTFGPVQSVIEVTWPAGSIATQDLTTGMYRIATPSGGPGVSGPAFVEEPKQYATPGNAALVSETQFDRKVGKLPWYKDWLYIAPIGLGAVAASAVVLLSFKRARKRRR